MKRLFIGYPNSYEIIDHIKDRLQKELDTLEEDKKRGISWWSEDRFARYSHEKYVYRQQLKELDILYKEVDEAEKLEDSAIGNFEDYPEPDPPF